MEIFNTMGDMKRALLGLLGLGLAGWAWAQPQAGEYPYRSPVFTTFVQDSYRESPAQGVQPFYAWFEAAYAKTPQAKLEGYPNLGLMMALAQRKKELAALRDPAAKTKLELETGAWLHRLVKSTLLKFSLERGYEFTYAVARSERQCLLQSVLIAGMLQQMGIEAGAYMVWKNQQGQVSNLGHVTAVIKLSDGRDVEIDASEPTPFFTHQGIFAPIQGKYQFAEPIFNPDHTISGYKLVATGQVVKPRAVTPLSFDYLRSQFYYYRGERAPGGFLAAPKTPEGLAASERFLRQAVRYAPENPLATYVLGLVLQREGKAEEARAYIRKGYALYEQYGYVPDGPKAAFAAASR